MPSQIDTPTFDSTVVQAPVATVSATQWKLEPSVAYRPEESEQENRLVQARLGVGSSLFTTLRCKHAPTAAHSLRVALCCSSWGLATGVDEQLLSDLEVAALLHDIGKIGVPDRILLKPGRLTSEETKLVRTHRSMGLEILKSFRAPKDVLEIIRYAPIWFRPEETNGDPVGEELPLGARMLAIADAFDSMTNDQVYRPAQTRHEAMSALVDGAGTQFDPQMVKEFYETQQRDNGELHTQVARRWLRQLVPDQLVSAQQLSAPGFPAAAESLAPLFLEKLIDSMRDGVVFVDRELKVRLWNRGAERLSGTPASQVLEQPWRPRLVALRDEKDRGFSDDQCPVRQVIESGVQSIRRVQITGSNRRPVSIDMHIVPVAGPNGETQGANILMHDASSETTLEERCQTLHEKATRDPLTQVANRAEFDLQHQSFIDTHVGRNEPCSLIICDIDHFKKVNDTYGHPAGDEALRTFSQFLADNCRPGDLVARYGGEEFVILCADCDLATAFKRAEKIRHALEKKPLKSLGGKRVTASFGVTETSSKDTAKSMLLRADQALLQAKSGGRNMVVQVGPNGRVSGGAGDRGWFGRRKTNSTEPVLESEIVADVPLRIAVEKLRGFVAEYKMDVEPLDASRVQLRFEPDSGGMLRRQSDRAVSFLMELTFTEEQVTSGTRPGQSQTRIAVAMQPCRPRDRRRSDLVERASRLAGLLQSYLLAKDARECEDEAERRDTTLVGTWLAP